MNFHLELYHNILFLGLQPNKNHSKKDAYYKEQLLNVKNEYYSFQPRYQCLFEKPLSAKRKYYVSVIENEAIKQLNTFVLDFQNALLDNIKKYLFNNALKAITQKFNEIYIRCKKGSYSFERLKAGVEDENEEDEIYIFFYLRTELIRIYLEITEAFNEFATDEFYNEEEVYKKFFKETSPPKDLIIAADNIQQPVPASKMNVEKTSKVFKAMKKDIREPNRKIILYDTIIKNPQYFAQFEEYLFSNELIDNKYNFIEVHGNKLKMANVYCALIKKNYFHPRDFKAKKTITPLHIKHFLNHRYNTNIDKEFRNILANPQNTIDFIANNILIEQLPTC